MAERNFSPESREKLSRLMKERHARGEVNPGGRAPGTKNLTTRKKERITKAVAEAAAEEKNRRDIINVFKDAIHPSQPIQVRLKGAEAWAKIAADQNKIELQEEAVSAQQHSREELLELLSQKLTSGPTANLLRTQIEQENIVDVEVVEVEEDEA
jgi:hypothetical protein